MEPKGSQHGAQEEPTGAEIEPTGAKGTPKWAENPDISVKIRAPSPEWFPERQTDAKAPQNGAQREPNGANS